MLGQCPSRTLAHISINQDWEASTWTSKSGLQTFNGPSVYQQQRMSRPSAHFGPRLPFRMCRRQRQYCCESRITDNTTLATGNLTPHTCNSFAVSFWTCAVDRTPCLTERLVRSGFNTATPLDQKSATTHNSAGTTWRLIRLGTICNT
jgi:hypothetical protein